MTILRLLFYTTLAWFLILSAMPAFAQTQSVSLAVNVPCEGLDNPETVTIDESGPVVNLVHIEFFIDKDGEGDPLSEIKLNTECGWVPYVRDFAPGDYAIDARLCAQHPGIVGLTCGGISVETLQFLIEAPNQIPGIPVPGCVQFHGDGTFTVLETCTGS